MGVEVALDGGYHITLFAEDKAGYSNLCRLISHSKKTRTSLDWETLSSHSKGLICLSGCRKSEVATYLLQNKLDEASRAAQRYRALFGGDNFWIELQRHLLPGEARLCDKLVNIARQAGIGYVATNNVHYATPEGYRLQDEMTFLFSRYPEAVSNSLVIAERCHVDLNLEEYRFPDFPVPPGETSMSYLRELCRQGAEERYEPVGEQVIE
ncbi:PHP domain-containing protein [Dehalococcoidia bacterium]|nr:PHP domain-containing protein [Dehalococcoidia bacterium]